MNPDIEFLSLVFLIFTLAAFVHGSIGYGYPMFSTPLLALVCDMESAILLTLFPTIFINSVNVFRQEKNLAIFREYALYPLFIFLGSWIGSLALVSYDAAYFKLLMAAMIVLYLYLKLQRRFDWKPGLFANQLLFVPLFGFLGGFVGGTINVMLAVTLIYVSGLEIGAESRIRFLNMTFLFGKVSQVIFFGFRPGFFDADYAMQSAFGVLACVPGLYLGLKLRPFINERLYQKILFASLFAIAFFLLCQFGIFAWERWFESETGMKNAAYLPVFF